MLFLLSQEKSKKGFTIVEVMIAMAIFAIGILGVAKMQLKSTNSNTTSRTMTEASTFAVDQIEQLMSVPYDNAAMAANSYTNIQNQMYNLSWRITDNNPVTNTKQIAMTVTFRNGTRTFTTNYYRAKDF